MFPDEQGNYPNEETTKKNERYGEKVIRRVVETKWADQILDDWYNVEHYINYLQDTGANLSEQKERKPKYTSTVNIEGTVSKVPFITTGIKPLP